MPDERVLWVLQAVAATPDGLRLLHRAGLERALAEANKDGVSGGGCAETRRLAALMREGVALQRLVSGGDAPPVSRLEKS